MSALNRSVEKDSQLLMSEATLCYKILKAGFSETTQGQEAVSVLRRIALPGQKLTQFSGPTLEGGYLDGKDFVDRVTVIYFWDSQNSEFIDKLLPLLQQASSVSNGKLRFVGVPLDQDEAFLKAFLAHHQVPGQQIFFPAAGQQGWDSPLVRFWGVSKSARVWLIDRDGKVASVDVGGDRLVEQMRLLFN